MRSVSLLTPFSLFPSKADYMRPLFEVADVDFGHGAFNVTVEIDLLWHPSQFAGLVDPMRAALPAAIATSASLSSLITCSGVCHLLAIFPHFCGPILR